jgi:hypothetical protein
MESITPITITDFKKALKECKEAGENPEITQTSSTPPDIIKPLSSLFTGDKYKEHAIAGVDIYEYSKYPEHIQRLIPFTYELISIKTLRECLTLDKYIFQKINGEENFPIIPTGDGGFHIFETPLHALFFIFHLESITKLFNAYEFHPELRRITGQINLRYSITFGNIFKTENNYFGPAIITNSRILKKDKLNRLLIDSNCYEWFLENTSGIETLKFITLKRLSSNRHFAEYKKELMEDNYFLLNKKTPSDVIIRSDVLKIGNIKSKNSTIDIYNIHFQLKFYLGPSEPDEDLPFVISVGNLNPIGLE